LLTRAPRVRRTLGRTYVGAAWLTSGTGLGTALAFDVGLAGTLAFAVFSVVQPVLVGRACRATSPTRSPCSPAWPSSSPAGDSW
jgi:hypothetical protein